MRTRIRLLLLLASMFFFIGSYAQPPYVYTSENTATGYPAPPLPTIDNCPVIPLLPDPFEFANETHSADFSDWEHHRSDFKAMIENYEIGTKPDVDTANVTATYSSGTLTVHVKVNGKTLTLTSAVTIPSGASAPYPVCIGMDSPYGFVTSSDFTSRGIVGITFNSSQITTSNSPSVTDPFFTLYPSQNPDNTGQYAAWAWGVSRIIDGLYKVKSAGTFNADLSHICVTGCSYAGKMALFAGAFDERIALTIAQESGGGGATSWRYTNNTLPVGSVEGIAETSTAWFKNSLFDFSNENVTKLPDDHHMLMAMCAPRALYCTGNTDYTWLSNRSNYVCDKATEQIYDSLGIADRFGFNIDGGHSHCAFPSDQEADMAYFLDRFMIGSTDTSEYIRTHPAGYDTIDYANWTSWWGPIPVTGVSINPDSLRISTGYNVQLTPVFVPYNATIRRVSWSSSDTSVAKIDSAGMLTSVANGTAKITVTTADGAKTDTCFVTVTNISVAGVSISPAKDTVGVGSITQLTAIFSPPYVSNANVTWSSGNTAVATVDSTGFVSGVSAGTATITVTTEDGGKTATANVVVEPSGPIYINAGGPAVGNYIADAYYSGGTVYANPNTIDTSKTAGELPGAIFKTERYGAFSYTIPNRPLDTAITVTLYFAETYVTGAGQRLFNVTINGKPALTNFDIYVAAGGMNKSIARKYVTKADNAGKVVLNFITITQSPKINGISVVTGGSFIVADAGKDQTLTDTDNSGSESVTLDGSGSVDYNDTITSYVWKEGTTQIATGVKPQVDLTVGVHNISLTITNSHGDTATDTVTITINRPSSINYVSNHGISVYPNPVHDMLSLSLSVPQNIISLFNSEGQQLLLMNTDKTNVTIDMAKYQAGIYFLKITNSDQTFIEKLIKK